MRKRMVIVALIFMLMSTIALGQQTHLIDDMIKTMTIEEKVAQMFLARAPSSGALNQIESTQPGGYIFFANHFEGKTPDNMREAFSSYQAASKIPMLIAVDEEGGTVTRISRYKAFRSAKYQSPRALFEAGGLHAVVTDAIEKSKFLKELGINFNLAPVCDIAVKKGEFMYSRSLGQDAKVTSHYISAVVSAMNQAGVASALKHFPGYGGNADTHTGLVRDKRTLSHFKERDLLPFEAGIKAGAGCILVSHNIVECLDEKNPASLSPEVHKLLREELGFEGVILTDDLYMGAIQQFVGTKQAAVLAVEAGNDLLCSTSYQTQFGAVLEAVQSGRIDEARIDESVGRILQWKTDLGILSAQ